MSSKWIKETFGNNPDTLISQMCIPGTHSSCGLHGEKATQSQLLSIQEQLELGIRFLDLALKVKDGENDKFEIYHAGQYQQMDFDKVLESIKSFLNGPGSEEFVILFLRKAQENPPNFSSSFENYMNNPSYSEMFYQGDSIPKYGDVKGKIVIVKQFEGSSPGMFFQMEDNTTGLDHNILYQDYHSLEFQHSTEEKIMFVKKMINQSMFNQNGEFLILNFCNVHQNIPRGQSSEQYAEFINPQVSEYMENLIARSCGILVLDFPKQFQGDLVQKIFENNKLNFAEVEEKDILFTYTNSNDSVRIKFASDEAKYWEIKDAGKEISDCVQLNMTTGSQTEFKVQRNDDGTISFFNVGASLFLGFGTDPLMNGCPLQLHSKDVDPTTKFRVLSPSSGTYAFWTLDGHCLEVTDREGEMMIQTATSYGDSTYFSLEKV